VGAFTLMLGTTLVLTQSPEERGLAIAREADARASGWEDSVAEMEMTLVARSGAETVRRLHARALEVPGDGDKSLVVFDTPRDISGTAVLTHAHRTGPDDQWLYLPALKRVKRIAAANQSSAFMGSEFTYEDFASEELAKYSYKLAREESCPTPGSAELGCFVIERYPTAATSGYRRQVVWLDRQEYRPWKIEYHDRRGTLLKTLTYAHYVQHLGRYWRAHEMVMVNHQTGRQTRLRWRELRFRTGLGESVFTTAGLRRARDD